MSTEPEVPPKGLAGPEAVAASKMDLPRTNVLAVEPWRLGRPYIPERWSARNRNTGLPKGWRENEDIIVAMDALNVLQLRRRAHIIPDCLRVCLNFYYEGLSNSVKKDVNILDPFLAWRFPGPRIEFDKWLDETFDPTQEAGYDRTPEAYQQIFEKPYVFWPIDSVRKGVHRWVTVVIHLTKTKDSELYTNIEGIAVIDPNADNPPRRRERIYERVMAFLGRCGIRSAPDSDVERDIWIPPMNPIQYPRDRIESFSSGLRSFDLIRQLLGRLTRYYSLKPNLHSGESFWRPCVGFFNPDAVRAEMIGYAAMEVNRLMEYTTRVAIEPIVKIVNGEDEIEIRDLAPNRDDVHEWLPGVVDNNGRDIMWIEYQELGREDDEDSSNDADGIDDNFDIPSGTDYDDSGEDSDYGPRSGFRQLGLNAQPPTRYGPRQVISGKEALGQAPMVIVQEDTPGGIQPVKRRPEGVGSSKPTPIILHSNVSSAAASYAGESSDDDSDNIQSRGTQAPQRRAWRGMRVSKSPVTESSSDNSDVGRKRSREPSNEGGKRPRR